jgi:hypothetical protein
MWSIKFEVVYSVLRHRGQPGVTMLLLSTHTGNVSSPWRLISL